MVIGVPHSPLGGQAQQALGGEAAFPVVDHGGLDRQECGHPPRAEADLQELNDPPAGLLFGRILVDRSETGGADAQVPAPTLERFSG